MEEAGLEFRATKDLDIVLHVEALTPAVWRGLLEIRRGRWLRNPPSQRHRKTNLLSVPEAR